MRSRDQRDGVWRAATLVLACALLGLLVGGALTRLRRPAPPPVIPPTVRPAVPPVPRPSVPPPAAPAALPDLGPVAPDGGAAAGLTLTVEVLDAHGQPAAGAAVLARRTLAQGQSPQAPQPPGGTSPSKPGPAAPIGELGVLTGTLPFPEDVIAGRYASAGALQRTAGGSAEGASATTGPDGKAVLVGIPSGYVQILASRDGLGAAAEIVAPAPRPGDQAPTLRLLLRLGSVGEASCPSAPESAGDPEAEALTSSGEGPEVGGQVTDARGQPIANARVEVTVGKRRQLALSDGRGGFSVRGLPLGSLLVQVRHPGYTPLSRTLRPDEPRGDLRLGLSPGGGIAGVVRDARLGGLPQGAQLSLESAGDPASRQAVALAPDGSFRVTGLAPGEVVLRARATGFAALQHTVRVTEGATPDSVTARDVVLGLERGASVLGQVSAPGAASRAGVSVQAEDASGRVLGRVLTDERGEFELADLPAGRLRISAAGSGGRDSTTVELRAGDRGRVSLELR